VGSSEWKDRKKGGVVLRCVTLLWRSVDPATVHGRLIFSTLLVDYLIVWHFKTCLSFLVAPNRGIFCERLNIWSDTR